MCMYYFLLYIWYCQSLRKKIFSLYISAMYKEKCMRDKKNVVERILNW